MYLPYSKNEIFDYINSMLQIDVFEEFTSNPLTNLSIKQMAERNKFVNDSFEYYEFIMLSHHSMAFIVLNKIFNFNGESSSLLPKQLEQYKMYFNEMLKAATELSEIYKLDLKNVLLYAFSYCFDELKKIKNNKKSNKTFTKQFLRPLMQDFYIKSYALPKKYI